MISPRGVGSASHWLGAIGVLLAVSILGVTAGCGGGSGPERFSVSGTVTFDGKPVPFGEIVFEPDSSAGNSGPQGYAPIVDGQFKTAGDRGSVGGPHLVRISGYPVDPSTEDEENPIKPLFRSYETKVDLPKENSTQEFQVPADAG